MKYLYSQAPTLVFFVLVFILMGNSQSVSAHPFFQQDSVKKYVEFKGKVINRSSEDVIPSAYLVVKGTNIATVANANGEFALKVPQDLTGAVVSVSYFGYESKNLPINYFRENDRVWLNEVQKLSEVNVFGARDAKKLVQKMLAKRGDNYLENKTLMTAFYRESIKRGNRNVSLSEAVAEIYKEPNNSFRKDDISLLKARKSTDYERLDTLALKLRGGPFNTLYLDIMKYPDFLFQDDVLNNYKFSFNQTTQVNHRNLYVVNFEEINQTLPWYRGQLFIDTQSISLVKAVYTLNVDNREKAARMFVNKKPNGSRVYPIAVNYQVNYRQANGKWYYGYGNAKLVFVVNWKRKLFNSRYKIDSEMAITNWENISEDTTQEEGKRIRPSVVMTDDVSGFTDLNFWGGNNIIEPEKSIQNAIEKIQRNIERRKQ